MLLPIVTIKINPVIVKYTQQKPTHIFMWTTNHLNVFFVDSGCHASLVLKLGPAEVHFPKSHK